MAEKFGDVEALGNVRNNFFRGLRSRLQEIISRTDARSAGQSAGGVGGSLKAEFLRGVGVEQI